ncbi:UDP-N-acetylmuramate--L-alanine ligase [Clostridium sp. 19966]|uniref:UDP-N-acetylmuramate--L-alanine ligase n=1 Tax=Clostridium sp. 19966 TaxID=2768166 RepID=UPI0028DE9A3E|nr:UDP-N-acetylmuramate--L-alanine ligase [Clostridium sp. 19966]MDT8715731.1 UDP-N-acetylmuramate--L-alanine ligase [Clostridium sp. 19966]
MNFNLNKDVNKTVHFIGIGGISMSGLAEILLEYGYKVSGSDMKESSLTKKLEAKGASIFPYHSGENVKDADIVVYTAAISNDNPELLEAKNLNKQIMDRAEFLGDIMKGHKYNIAISGTHGKTTTTSMTSHIFMEANTDPTILIGGELDLINGNVRAGKSQYFISEACEYKESFLKFFPYIAVVLNIDADHLDYYKDINHIKSSFSKFVSLVPKDGYVVGNAEDFRVQEIMDNAPCNIVSYGFHKGNFTAQNISFDEKGCASFSVIKNGTLVTNIKLNVPGRHNILNALSSIACADILNVNYSNIKKGIEAFKGTHKRFELKGVKNGVTVIDDYAHHPTEIRATLSTAKNYPHRRIVCVFQPHTYSRTLSLLNDFSEAFFDADELILADIYAAREKDTKVVSSNMLGDIIRDKGINCKNFHSFDGITNYLEENLSSGDLLLTVGAGDIVKVGENFLK